MKARIAAALAVMGLIGLGGAALAEDEKDRPNVAQPSYAGLTPAQNRALAMPKGPRPGIYTMRSLHSGNCVIVTGFAGAVDTRTRVYQATCPQREANPGYYEFIFLPHPAGGYTIRTLIGGGEGGRAEVPGQLSNCLSVAQGVVFGPARIEPRGCEVPNGAGWEGTGAPGQRFYVQPSQGAWTLVVADYDGDNAQCIAAQGGSSEPQTDYIQWDCNGNADQRFLLTWIGPLAANVEAGTLARSGWFPFGDGPYHLTPANGVDLSGANYAAFETADDNGEYCMRRCAELAECKAWTWTGPGYVGADPPKCNWQHAAGTPINRGPASYAKLISGIVRQ